jgi:hypothetical protein
MILPQNRVNVETYSHPKKAPIVAHHPHALLEILIICHYLKCQMQHNMRRQKIYK